MQHCFNLHILLTFVLLSLHPRVNVGHAHRQNRNKKEPALYAVTSPVNHGEGPYYDNENQILYFVDISGFTVHRVNIINRNHTTLTLNDTVSFVIPVKGKQNTFAIGLGLNVQLLTWDGVSDDYKLQLVSSVDVGRVGNRFNDAKADPNGILWAGTIGSESPQGSGYVKPDQGSLNSWSPEDCEMKLRLSPVTISNGLAWSRNGSLLFYIDTTTRRIDAFNYNNGTISNRREVFDLEANKVPGFPDGMTIDESDNLWIACWGGSRVIHVDSHKRKLIRTLKLPVEKVTSVTFGGPHMNILFVTSMKDGLNSTQLEGQPLAGTTFAITNLGVKGVPSNRVIFRCDKDDSINF